MISRLVRYFSGRVGRRLFFLFVLSAFLPMAAFAVLSFNQSRDLLLKQGEQRLAATAKAFGMSLFERLQLLSDLAAASAGPDASRPAEGSLARSSFTSLARVRRDGTVAAIFGEPRVTRLGDAQRKRLAEGHPTLTVLPAAQGSLLVLAVPVNAAGEIAALAELAPGAFWQPEALPAATEFCVVDEDARTQLFCSAPMPEAALLADSREPRTAFGVSRWKRGDDAYLSASWSQYMRFAFGTADWVVVASQPEGFILARLLDYQRVYIPVVVLALLLVSWFTIRQSRAIVEPVAQLAEGARRVARNDFSVPVTMDRGDEFGELASAFNQMSTRLGRQIAALTALSEIDRLILDTPDTVQVVRTVLARMGAVVPADFFGIALFNPGRAGHANAYFRDPEASEGVGVANVEVGPRDRELLVRNPNGTWILLEESDVGILRQLRERGMRTAYVQPIVWRESLCGALALGYREAASGGQEARQQAREFADRVAVAVSSAWRDEQLYQQAHFDALTELPNRLLLKDRLRQEIARSQREKSRFGVLFIDIDRFKDVNDSLGHSVGDSVLRESARRIVACVRESDTVSRLGGDEFAVLLTHVQQPQDTGRVAGNVVKELSRAFEFDGQQLFLSASIGVASFPEDGSTAEELLKNADTAMYRAKAGGRARVKYFEESMNTEAVARLTLDRDLRLAIDRGELEVHYQPLVDVRSGAIRGAEALMRWRHPERGEIAPVRFIPVAEESGLIERIGRFALEQACAQIKAWQREGLALQRISVNVSPRQLREPGVMAMVRECAREAGVGLDALELEITEGLLIEHAESVEGLLREMHDSGLRIALDDFGTGFSSMAYLTRFPIDTIKIDRVFVDGLGSSRDSRAIVEAVIVMGHALGKTVVAEGVETPGQLALLTELGCDEVQGYHFARPMPAGAFVEFARAHAASRSRGVAVAQKAIPG